MRVLLNRYHPVVEDLSLTFLKLGFEVDVAVNTNIKDHYGDWKKILSNLKEDKFYGNINFISLSESFLNIKRKKYDLIGVDGAFSGDDMVMSLASSLNVPFFCIDGYPYKSDEPADNILSFGWWMPQYQFLSRYNNELAVKARDLYCPPTEKNFLIFYPNFWKIKFMINDASQMNEENLILSGIQRYEECNKNWYDAYLKIVKESNCEVKNIEGVSRADFLNELVRSKALLHLKWADRPGIVLLEAMIIGRPVLTLSSFVLSSFNQDLLIDNYNSIIEETVDGLIERINNDLDKKLMELSTNAFNHSWLMTDFNRQKIKLENFIDRCVR